MPSLDGVLLTSLKIIPDERGQVMHILRADAPHFTAFGEVYVSSVYGHTLKAWKLHTSCAANIAVPHGRVKFVLHDKRLDSPTHSQTQVVFLGENTYQLLHIPPGVAYGWKNLLSETAYIINCATEPHRPDEGKLLAPQDIPYEW